MLCKISSVPSKIGSCTVGFCRDFCLIPQRSNSTARQTLDNGIASAVFPREKSLP